MNFEKIIPKKLRKVLPEKFRTSDVTVPVVRLHGAIMASQGQFSQRLNLASVAAQLEKAFSDKQAPAVALSINSPGGSPVQSNMIFKRIRALATKHDKQVLVFVEDVAASGGYMIAVAGDEIYVDPSSIVGSIGVVSSGFGFTELIKKIGVDRRVYTAGTNKATLDPFKPEKKSDIDHLKKLQLVIHDVFISMVKERRGDKLTDSKDLFTGMFWAGEEGIALGLVDGLGDMSSIVKEKFGEKTKLQLISAPRGFFGRKSQGVGIFEQMATNVIGNSVSGALSSVEERTLWSRFGL